VSRSRAPSAAKKRLERQVLDWARRYGERLMAGNPEGKWQPGSDGYVPTKYARALLAEPRFDGVVMESSPDDAQREQTKQPKTGPQKSQLRGEVR
jgi:hypothetical protein